MATSVATKSILHAEQELLREGDIRVIRSLQLENGKIHCELRTVNLRDEPQYFAISYTWGPSTDEEAARGITNAPVHEIICNTQRILVTENLYAFLRRAVARPELAWTDMWIDSICIDQSSPVERTSQVQLMATIYHSANAVIVWLGEEDEHTRGAFELVQALGRHTDEQLHSLTPKNFTSPWARQMSAPCDDISFWRSLAIFFQRRYFTRVWIIQEITLAKRILTLCGQYTVDWGHVVKVSKFLTITSWTRCLSPGGMLTPLESKRPNYAIPNLIDANRQTRMKDERKVMLFSLIRFRRFEAFDPRDKVYALLGVASSSTTGKARYNPEYGDRSTAETYINAATQILLDSDDLLLLAHVEKEEPLIISSLPSWVPDWSSTRIIGLGVTGYDRFSAAGDLPRILKIDEKSQMLIVSGKKIDTVTATAESKTVVLNGAPFPRLLDMLCALPEPYHTGQSPSEVFWRTLITDTAGQRPKTPAPQEHARDFASWFGSRMGWATGHGDGMLLAKALDRFAIDGLNVPLMEEVAKTVEGDEQQEDHDAAAYEATYGHSPHLSAFTTARNYFGMGPEALSNGDEIWVLAGSRVPLALRRAGQGAFRVVGGAYVHGLMHGEALELDGLFEEVTLV